MTIRTIKLALTALALDGASMQAQATGPGTLWNGDKVASNTVGSMFESGFIGARGRYPAVGNPRTYRITKAGRAHLAS